MCLPPTLLHLGSLPNSFHFSFLPFSEVSTQFPLGSPSFDRRLAFSHLTPVEGNQQKEVDGKAFRLCINFVIV